MIWHSWLRPTTPSWLTEPTGCGERCLRPDQHCFRSLTWTLSSLKRSVPEMWQIGCSFDHCTQCHIGESIFEPYKIYLMLRSSNSIYPLLYLPKIYIVNLRSARFQISILCHSKLALNQYVSNLCYFLSCQVWDLHEGLKGVFLH